MCVCERERIWSFFMSSDFFWSFSRLVFFFFSFTSQLVLISLLVQLLCGQTMLDGWLDGQTVFSFNQSSYQASLIPNHSKLGFGSVKEANV